MKYLSIKILFTLLILCSAFAQAYSDDACMKGKAAFDKGDYAGAVKFLRDGVQNDPKNAKCFMWLGTALLKMDSVDQAVGALVQAHDLDTANADIYTLLGDAYGMQKILPAALEQYQRAASFDSTNPARWKKIAEVAFKARKYSVAVTALGSAIRLDTNDIESYRQLGHLYFRDAMARNNPVAFEKVIAPLQKVYNANPKDSLRTELARALFETRHYKDLIPVGETILKDDSTQAEITREVATAYTKTGDNDHAAPLWARIAGDSTKMKAADYVDLAKSAQALDHVDEAIASYEHAIRIADSTTVNDVAYSLGSLYMKQKRYPEAIAMFEKKIALDTASGYQFASNYNEAICLMQGKDFDNARIHILKGLQYKPDYVAGWRALAEDYAQLDSTSAERAAYRKVLELATGTGTIDDKNKDAVAEAYRMEGFNLLLTDKKYPASIEMLKKALALEEDKCQTLLWLAQASSLANKVADGKMYYCKVVATCTKNPKIYDDALKGLTALGTTPDACGK
ncbi:MAG TPA: tetratricopeptide repeat protein [Bacteroidota bacterium]|nr:tetratricopeptide repeat protein [Bacteroidota bacterium]